jgi:hypothetical protein
VWASTCPAWEFLVPIKTEIARELITRACAKIVENACHAALAAEAAQAHATAGLHGEAIQTLLDAEPFLHDARKYLELAAFVSRKAVLNSRP